MPSTDLRYNDAASDIWQHMVNNSDWTIEQLLVGRLKLLDSGDEVFFKFLEAYVHPLVRKDQDNQRNAVEWLNPLLFHEGLRLVRSDDSPWGRYAIQPISGSSTGAIPVYEIVLSFAGEQRPYVDRVASVLFNAGVSIFYDNYEVVNLWGKNLAEHFHQVYGGTARYCVMFISSDYAQKVWPSHERQSTFDAAVARRVEYILPVRFDNTEIPGLMRSVHYVTAQQYDPEKLAELILQKLGRLPLNY
jgi:AbiJ N-terminal domain 3/TIR domain